MINQIDNSLPGDPNHIETKRGNYLQLNAHEAEAIRQYTGSGNVMINMLFNTDIVSIVPRLQHWAWADESIETFLNLDVVVNTIGLYSALLKAHLYHQSNFDTQEHPGFLYRGSTGDHHSDGFKSFTTDPAMAESFGNDVYGVPFPDDIPFISSMDIYNYAPNSSRREEREYLFSPFCNITPLGEVNLFSRRRPAYILKKRKIQYSKESLPSDINENLRVMANNISRYTQVTREITELKRRQKFDTEYEALVSERETINMSYKKASEEVLNYIAFQCAMLDEAHGVS